MSSLDRFAREKLVDLEAKSRRRELVMTERGEGASALRSGRDGPRRLISFCCNDYLNLSQHPALKEAAIEAVRAYGVGSGASRLVTGNHPLFDELETRLARLKGAEAAVVFGSGYLANAGIIPTLVGAKDLILIDELAHACMFAGSSLAGSAVRVIRHNDVEAFKHVLDKERHHHRRAMILTDGVFSMDGDLAPVRELGDLADDYDAWLMTDDAHGIGVVGGGRGSTYANLAPGAAPPKVHLQMGTLSKAIGGYGGYLCASKAVIDLIKTRARTLIYSTGLPPATIAAAIAALDVIEQDAEFRDRPVAHARQFARALNLPWPESPIVPVIIGPEKAALEASAMLEAEGYLVTAIRPPTVPEGTARLRFTFTADHDPADIERLAHFVRTRILPVAAA